MPKHPDSSRRNFLKTSGVLGVAVVAGKMTGNAATVLPPLPANPATEKAMPMRNLGRTGYRVGIFSLGGQAAIEQPNNEAIAVPIVERALDLGVNYIDTAAMYGGEERWSQRYVGEVMKRRRNQAYLASKTHDRTRDGSLKLLEQSLKLLNTGHLDPDLLIQCLERFPFDQILMALNAADKHHLSFQEKLLPLAVEKKMGIIGMKIPARGRILASWKPDAQKSSGFEGHAPGPGTLAMKEAMYYVLSQPVSTVIIGCDTIAQLEENVQFARDFTPLSERQLAALSERTLPVARQSLFFRRWA